jgi:fatty-acyl-CoA synthase
MVEWSTRLGSGLLELGIQPGEHVGVVMANHPEFVALKFAISRIGAVSVPINFLLKDRELAYVLKQSDVVARITMDRFRDNEYLGILDRITPNWKHHAGGTAVPSRRKPSSRCGDPEHAHGRGGLRSHCDRTKGGLGPKGDARPGVDRPLHEGIGSL